MKKRDSNILEATLPNNINAKRKPEKDTLPSKDIPAHVAAQMSLNKVILKKLTNAVERDPCADLTVILSDLNKTYPAKRKAATEKRAPIRRVNGPLFRIFAVKDNILSCATGGMASTANLTARQTMVDIHYPLDAEAVKALASALGCPEEDVHAQLAQLPDILASGEVLLEGKVVALGGNLVVKFCRTVEPAELHLMQYINKHCPEMKCPKPLGFVILDEKRYLFMSRVAGTTLEALWPSLTVEGKDAVSHELEEMLCAMRELPRPSQLALGNVSPPYICQDTRTYTRIGGPIHDEVAFNDFLLRDPLPRISSSYIAWMRFCLRTDHRIVMSHGDLHPRNIILCKDGDTMSISGIVDWELGGWYPEYWEALKAVNTRATDDDRDWWCRFPPSLSTYTSEIAINRLVEPCTR